MPDCSDIRKQWDEAFDADESPTSTVCHHVAGCVDCRSYARAASVLREALQIVPLGAANDEADRAILRTLRADSAPAAPLRRPVFPLVFAGAGSFALTMIVAGIMLSAASGSPATPSPAAPSGIAARPSPSLPDSDAELDAWLASPGLLTGSRGYRPAAAPAAPPKRRSFRGQSAQHRVA